MIPADQISRSCALCRTERGRNREFVPIVGLRTGPPPHCGNACHFFSAGFSGLTWSLRSSDSRRVCSSNLAAFGPLQLLDPELDQVLDVRGETYGETRGDSGDTGIPGTHGDSGDTIPISSELSMVSPEYARFRPRFARLSLKHGGPHLSDKIVLSMLSRMALREGVSRFHQMACVFRAPDNADIILIFSLLHVARIWGFFAFTIS